MSHKPPHDEREDEARKVIERVERDSEIVGRSSFVRAAGKARDHLTAAEADADDPVEVWGRRVGRILSVIAFIVLALWLFAYLTR
ncbi:MAG: hypothetical protein JJ920_19645 [Roseitalea sp.]|jgi:hypothetical protein|nr:hypothetical protein [Roseitalea sp.]MBO6722580.1 hypothetical protein [Roseitalea sp.]MBO6745131.1 hypothetical protein [Roseitalea sp.]